MWILLILNNDYLLCRIAMRVPGVCVCVCACVCVCEGVYVCVRCIGESSKNGSTNRALTVLGLLK